MQTDPVLVVGAGPVGALLGNLLGLAGVATLVVERDRGVADQPRAAQLDDDALRVLQAAGLTGAIRPHVRAVRGLQLVGADLRPFWHFRDTDLPGPNGWPPTNTIHQPAVEAALSAGLDRFPSVSVRHGCELLALKEAGGPPAALLRDVGTGRTDWIRAWAVLGCDGARSTVRRLLGVPLRDRAFAQRWLVVDVEVGRGGRLGDWPVPQQVCDSTGPRTYVPMAGDRYRWEFLLRPGETADSFLATTPLAARLAPWTGGTDVTVVRQAVYTFHARQARQWRRGRVFLLGDAAHQMPPFLGQGLCAGIRDAANLAWKLALVLRGRAGDALLDTYEAERSPHVAVAIGLSTLVGRIVRGSGAGGAALQGALRAARRLPAAVRRPLEHVRTPGIPRGPLVLDGPFGRLGEPLGRRAVGLPVPQPPVRLPSRLQVPLDDALGPGFALLGLDHDPLAGLAAPERAFWERLGTTGVPVGAGGVADVTGTLRSWFAGQGGRVAVVRPDRYVLAVCEGRRLPSLPAVTARLRPLFTPSEGDGG